MLIYAKESQKILKVEIKNVSRCKSCFYIKTKSQIVLDPKFQPEKNYSKQQIPSFEIGFKKWLLSTNTWKVMQRHSKRYLFHSW